MESTVNLGVPCDLPSLKLSEEALILLSVALASPLRIRILRTLGQYGESTLEELSGYLGLVSVAFLKDLSALVEGGFVSALEGDGESLFDLDICALERSCTQLLQLKSAINQERPDLVDESETSAC